MNILIIGGGGREHALAWKVAQSPKAGKVFIAPGNAGTATEPKCQNVALPADDVDGLLKFAQQNKIDLAIVGPETPLVLGTIGSARVAQEGLVKSPEPTFQRWKRLVADKSNRSFCCRIPRLLSWRGTFRFRIRNLSSKKTRFRC